MRIAILSGKGGTGKTTVAASLFRVIDDGQYIDCDVEEPNGFLFLHPTIAETTEVRVLVPQVQTDRCDRCGACAAICQFHALAVTRDRVLVFPGLCHHCGACSLSCTRGAIREVVRRIGVVESDRAERTLQGRLDEGEPVGVPIITELKKRIYPDRTAIHDCAPGASCTVVRTLIGCDFALLVTEPTPFGLHDLKIAVAVVRQLGIDAGVILNKSGAMDDTTEEFCARENLRILLRIPYSRRFAEAYSRGRLPVDDDSEWVDRFKDLARRIGIKAEA